MLEITELAVWLHVITQTGATCRNRFFEDRANGLGQAVGSLTGNTIGQAAR